MSSSQSTLSSFNPHAVHPFTAAGTSSQSSLHPHHPHSAAAARTPKPSSHPSQAQPISTYSSTAPHAAPPQAPVQSPQPRHAPKHPVSSQPIFTPFKLERSSPELRDILVKKERASAWSVKASNAIQPAHSLGSNGGKK